MSRVLKFRAWVEGHAMYFSDQDDTDIQFDLDTNGVCLVLLEQFHECGSGVAEEYWRYVRYEDAPVMQYTGLKDKNGVEIYEGDVVNYDGYSTYLIEWDNDSCGFKTTLQQKSGLEFFLFTNFFEYNESGCVNIAEVIGNKYKTPEFLS